MILVSIQNLYSQNIVRDGKIDISKYDLSKSNIKLNGDWEFYYKQLLEPKDFNESKITNKTYTAVPGLWNKKEELQYSGKGYGTYRLVIKNCKQGKFYSINFNRINTAYKMWVNGKLKIGQGKVGKSFKEMEPHWSSKNIMFKAKKQNVEIVLQVSNFNHKKGGIENSVLFGNAQNIENETSSNFMLSIFLISVLLVMSIYHLNIYRFHVKDKSNLYFALTLLFSITFSGTVGEIPFTRIIENLDWELLIKTNYISNYLRLLFFALFLFYLFGKNLSKTITKGIGIISIVMSLFVLFTPAGIYTHTLIVFLILTIFSVVFFLIVLIIASIKKQQGALWSLAGIAIMFATVVNDVLIEIRVIDTVPLSTFGIFIFIFFQSHLISMTSANTYKTNKIINKKFEELAKIKNAFLSGNSNSLEKPLKVISGIIKSDRSLIFVKKNNKWFLNSEYIYKSNTFKNINLLSSKTNENELFLNNILKEAESSKKQTEIKITKNTTDKNLMYLIEHEIEQIKCIPFLKGDDIKAVFYIEIHQDNKVFNEKKLSIIEDIRSHFSIFIDNYTIYSDLEEVNKELEHQVGERTVEIINQNEELTVQRAEIEKQNSQLNIISSNLQNQNREITDSIHYAKKIQAAILPSINYLNSIFNNIFVFYRPKDILSGDFYRLDLVDEQNNEKIIFSVADCTGHGVPGALMSIISNNLLNKAIVQEKIFTPAQILDNAQKNIHQALKHDGSKNSSKDGMDIAIISYTTQTKTLEFAGARNPLYIVRKDELIEYKPDLISIGGYQRENSKRKSKYTNHIIKIEQGDIAYMFSDGYIDQIGGKNKRKFMRKAFKKLLIEISKKDLKMQEKIINDTLTAWQGDNKQIDDILVTGIKF